jgi:hypothetical protein
MFFGPAKSEFFEAMYTMSPASPLFDEHLRRGPRHEERALGHDVALQFPVRLSRLEERLRQREARVVHHEFVKVKDLKTGCPINYEPMAPAGEKRVAPAVLGCAVCGLAPGPIHARWRCVRRSITTTSPEYALQLLIGSAARSSATYASNWRATSEISSGL